MLRRSVMAAVTRKKGMMKETGSPGTAASRGPSPAMIPAKTQIRLLNSQSSPIYKTQSASGLTDGFRNLHLRDGKKTQTTVRRNFFVGSSNATVKSLEDVSALMKENAFRKVVILAGAGISTPSGIPDFRTPGTGLYDNLQRYNIPYPEAIFDIDYFHHNPRPFYMLAKELYPSGKYRPNYSHYFARMLHEKGILLRMYTQNIDGLERLAGIPPEKLVEAHGTFATATCTHCRHRYLGEEIKSKIFEEKIPKCKQRGCYGLVKPDIVFFGEDLPAKFYSYLKDMLQADLAIVMGTSLEVQPFAGIIDNVRWGVPRILINKEAVGPFRFRRRTKDVVATGDLLETTQKMVGMIGWKEEMTELITSHEEKFKIGEPYSATVPFSDAKKAASGIFDSLNRQHARLNLLSDTESDSSDEDGLSSSSVTSSSSGDEKPLCNRGRGSKPHSKFSNQRNAKLPNKNNGSSQNGTANHAANLRKKPPVPSIGKVPTPTDDASSVSDVSSVNGVSVGKTPLRTTGNETRRSKASTKGSSLGTSKNDSTRKFSTFPLADSNSKVAKSVAPVIKKPVPAASDKKPAQLHTLGRRLGRPPVSERRTGPTSKVSNAPPSAIQVYRQIRRAGSADLPKLSYRHKLQRPYEERVMNVRPSQMYGSSSSASSESDSDSR